MTLQEVIKSIDDEILMLKNAPKINGCEMTYEWREQLEISKMAKSALEKQILKKPMRLLVNKDNMRFGDCPCCERLVSELNDKHHCPCGQALDWS